MGVLFSGLQRDLKRAPNAASVSAAGFGSRHAGGMSAQREENPSHRTFLHIPFFYAFTL